jgi:outer membrane protein OmpU
MKKVLFSTTALVLSAGVAFAEGHGQEFHGESHGLVTVGGFAGIWVSDGGGDDDDIQINNEIGIDFSGSGETDGGLGFGMDYTLLDNGGGIKTDNWEVYISGSWGKLTVGDPDNALQMVAGIGDIGFDGFGVDNAAEVGRGAGSAGGVLYSNTLGAATVYASVGKDISNDDVAVGVKFTAGEITFGLGYVDAAGINFDSDGDGDDDVATGGITAVDVSGSFGAMGFDVYYEDHDLGNNYGTIISYDAGTATINVGYADGDNGPEGGAMGVGFAMDLGGGAELAGGVADNGTDTAWDLGVSMSF